MTTSIYIVEDHPLVQRILSEVLKRMLKMHVAGVAATGQEALHQISIQWVDLVLVDVSLPDMDGIDLVTQLHRQWPTLLCVMLSAHQESGYVQRALAAGARGYIAKGNPVELVDAIQCVLRNEIYLSEILRDGVEAPG